MKHTPRRDFLQVALLGGAGALAASAFAADPSPVADVAPAPQPPPVPDEFPTQPPELVREMVGVCHANLERATELLRLRPTLANAAWDWGFGDWETALGAASHMGRVDIAKLLLANGARPSIFSAAMLGQLAVVRAFVEASPGVQGTAGPHGITLLAHARAGGERAKPVVDHLVSVGGADPTPRTVELTAEAAARYAGTYSFGPRDADRIEISTEKGSARFRRAGGNARALLHRGDHSFSPAGAPAVRVRFGVVGAVATELTVHDPDVVLRARRVG